MKRKCCFYFIAILGLLGVCGCSQSKSVKPSEETITSTDTVTPKPKEKTQTPTEAVTAEPTQKDPTGNSAGQTQADNGGNSSKDNSDDLDEIIKKYQFESVIPLESEDYHWAPEQLYRLIDGGKIVEIANGTEFVTEFSDPVKIKFQFEKSTDMPEDYIKYSLSVNDNTITNETLPLVNKVYMATLNQGRSYQLIIQEQGYGPYPYLYIFSFDNYDQKLEFIGTIEGSIDSLRICEDGTFTAEKNARCIESWWYAQRYIIGESSYNSDDDTTIPEVVVEMAPEMHPIGTQVVTNQELPLLACQTDTKAAVTVPAHTKLVLSSSDDVNWLYVTTPVDTPEESSFSGYIRLSGTDHFLINGKKVLCTQIFSYLLFAG